MTLGRFVLDGIAGRGGMGEVYRGRHAETGLPVAVKVLTAARASEPELVRGFTGELRAMASLDHPGIVQIYEHGTVSAEAERQSEGAVAAGSPYLVMEWADGGTLASRPDPTGWAEVCSVLVALLEALAHAHSRGVLHRDLKPSNVLRAGERYKLSDFGVARVGVEAEGGELRGTPAYMAPEQITLRSFLHGPPTDLYALGCLAWKLLTGAPPFAGRWDDLLRAHLQDPPPPFAPRFETPPGLLGFLARLLEKEPRSRYQMAAEARRALRELEPTARSTAPPGVRRARPPGAGLSLLSMQAVPLVGRADERRRLDEALDRVRTEGRARLLALVGPVGAGKSTLARFLCERAHEQGLALSLRATHAAIRSTGDGIDAALARAAGLVPPPELGAAVERITELGGPGLGPGEAARLAEVLTGASQEERLSLRERQALLCKMLAAVACGRPLVLWLDDVQWGVESLAFVEELLDGQESDPLPVLVLVTSAEASAGAAPGAWRRLDALLARPESEAVAIGDLAPEHARVLVREKLGLDAELAARVVDRTGGNPLFAVELVRSWLDAGALAPGPGGHRLVRPDRLERPIDLHRTWSERLEGVLAGWSGADAYAVELAAVLGQELDVEEWAAACEAGGLAVAWALVDKMLGARLLSLSAGSRTLVWAHPMLRESAEQRAVAGGRAARWHRLCAEALAGKPLETVAERLGRHRLRAGDVEGALRPLLLAARRRDRHGDPAGALAVLSERAAAMESANLPPSHPAWPEGQLLEAELHRYTGAVTDAARIAARAWDAARSYGHFHLIGDLLVARAEVARSEGKTADAAALLRRAFPHVEAAGDHARLASLLHSIVRVELDLGNADDAAKAAAEALEASERAGDPGLIGWSHEKLGKVHEWHGRIGDAQACFERAAALAAEHALPRLETTALLGLATVLRERGLLDQAEGLLRRAAEIDRRSGDASAVFTELNIATVLLESSKFAEARALLDRCADHPMAGRSPFLVAAISLSRAAAAAGEGDFEQYDRDIAAVEHALSGSAIVDIDFARVSCLAGDLAAEAGEVARASRAWDMARAHYLALGRSREAESLPRPRS